MPGTCLRIFAPAGTHGVLCFDKKIPQPDKIVVEARTWSKTDGLVHYSDWKPYSAVTIENLKGFQPVASGPQTLYGSDARRKFRATGFFYTIKDGHRWWIVDPEGYANLNVAVNSVRPGNSERNEKAFKEKFGTHEQWISSTHKELEAIGFNGSACWSEIPMIKYSNQQCSTPLSYTVMLNLYSGYQLEVKKVRKPESSFLVFDPAFEQYVDKQAQKLAEMSQDPNLFGYFSDNELSFNPAILDEFLSLKDKEDPNYLAASHWVEKQGIKAEQVTSNHREIFLGTVAEKYYQVVTNAIRKYDPNHLYLGSRLHGKPKHNSYVVAAAGKYCDILSINYYGQWDPSVKHFSEWEKWTDKPVIITEFYTKGDDSGLPNVSGAGWRVKTQEERGIFYENFCLKLLQMKNCVGWNWFRYLDNDPTDTTQDESNNDSNKGIVNNYYEVYQPLTNRMKRLNDNRYDLIRYFDR